MKPKKALNDLKKVIYDLTNPLYFELLKEQFETLGSLIEKQNEKLVNTTKEHKLYNCPTCDKGVKIMESYCWHCGQKLYFEKPIRNEEEY